MAAFATLAAQRQHRPLLTTLATRQGSTTGNKGAPPMNLNTAIFLYDDNVRAVAVEYEAIEDNSQRKLAIFKTFDDTLKPGDIVAVPTSTRVGFTACRVVEADHQVDLDTKTPIPWIAGKLNIEAFAKLKDQEQTFLAAMRRVQHDAERKKMREAVGNMAGMEKAIAALPKASDAPAE
jgi:hypothetical protein